MTTENWQADLYDAMPEKELQADVIALAQAHGWDVKSTWKSYHSPKGDLDLRMCRTPRYIEAELKTQRGKVTVEQQQRIDLLNQCLGVRAYVWRPSDWFGGTVERTLRRD